ncbi:hypothetical protein [Glutamicibacter sp. NPDC090743]|uniref:hypothetical protein n=1 Tax=Glutamicibacter sp. NPDC090743 TaxID=3364001 RepID=UPI0037F646D7
MRTQRTSPVPLALAVAVLMLAAGCSQGPGSETPESPPQPTSADTATAEPPASTGASTEAQSADPAVSSAEPTTAALTLFYVAVGDEGKSGSEIGCGDSLVATETGPEEFTNQVEASITALLADDEEMLGESVLRNALAGSDLDYVSSAVEGDAVTVELSGTVKSGGACDDPRIVE